MTTGGRFNASSIPHAFKRMRVQKLLMIVLWSAAAMMNVAAALLRMVNAKLTRILLNSYPSRKSPERTNGCLLFAVTAGNEPSRIVSIYIFLSREALLRKCSTFAKVFRLLVGGCHSVEDDCS